jgi:hypothetical protein
MAIIYERKWSNRFSHNDGTPNVKVTKFWALTLAKAGVTSQGLRRCLNKTIEKHPTFAPTLPEVIQMCQPSEEDLGLPSFEEAYYEATIRRGRFFGPDGYWKWAQQTHLAVYHALKNIKDKFRFDHLPSEQARKVFKEAWQKVVNRLIAGDKLEPVPSVIEDQSQASQEQKPCSPEEARKWINKCFVILKHGATHSKHDRANLTVKASRSNCATSSKDAIIIQLKQRLSTLEQEKQALEQALEQALGGNQG